MSHSTNNRTLINRGRKAGLTTRELYSAMANRPSEGSDQPGQFDCNGFVSCYDQQGKLVYRPISAEQQN